jgi:hypothetical protein
MQLAGSDFRRKDAGLCPFHCQAARIGGEAKNLIASPLFSGKVLAVFSNGIYLLGHAGKILWVTLENLPMHRRCIAAFFQPRSFCVGQTFLAHGSCLHIGETIVIDLNQAEEWKPLSIRPEQAEPLVRVNEAVCRLFATIPRPVSNTGFGQTIPMILAMAEGRNLKDFFMDFLVARAIDPILGIARACLEEDIVEIVKGGRELIGLGPGLTPSGDDFLGGVLFVAHSLKKAYPKEFFWEDEPVANLIKWSNSRTNPISYAILSDLCVGHGPEPLHDIVSSLLSGKDWRKVMLSINQLLRIGHASGWDLLAGLLTGLLMVRGKVGRAESPPSSPSPLEGKVWGGEPFSCFAPACR